MPSRRAFDRRSIGAGAAASAVELGRFGSPPQRIPFRLGVVQRMHHRSPRSRTSAG